MMLQLLGQCFHIEFADANGQPCGTTTAVKPIMFTFSRTRSRLFHVLSVGRVRQPCQKKAARPDNECARSCERYSRHDIICQSVGQFRAYYTIRGEIGQSILPCLVGQALGCVNTRDTQLRHLFAIARFIVKKDGVLVLQSLATAFGFVVLATSQTITIG